METDKTKTKKQGFAKAFRLKFWFRLFAVMDVLFSDRFELTTYRKDGSVSAKTSFSKQEIDEVGKKGLL